MLLPSLLGGLGAFASSHVIAAFLDATVPASLGWLLRDLIG